MFDWFWGFLYDISKTLFRLIDGLLFCANKLCGIETINFSGEETDFLSYLLFSNEISFAFRVSAVLATILLVIFSVFMIIRTIGKEKAEGTPTQIAVKAFKTLLMFFLVPAVMLAFMTIGNAFVKALYGATAQGSSSLGAFLFSAFARDGGMSAEYVEYFRTGVFDYSNTTLVEQYMNIKNFPFFFSYISGIIVLFGIGASMLTFVDRVLSLVILYIAAPISISTSVLDDGARFKLWRDQFLTKFIMGYGMILAINIYALVCGLITNSELVFFEDNAFLNLVMKLLIIGGGAITMQKSMALVGNLVSQGAGSNELRDSLSTAGLAKMTASAAFATGKGILKTADFLTLGKRKWNALGSAASSMGRKAGDFALGLMGFERKDGKGGDDKDSEKGSGSDNNEKASYGDKNKAKDSITGKNSGDQQGFKTSDWNEKAGGNANHDQTKQNGGGAVNNAITNGGNMEKKNNGGNNNDAPKKEENQK